MNSDSFNEPPNKRGRDGDKMELRFLIPCKSAGIIIGKGGANIKRLREEYQTRVTVPDSNGPERVLVLEGEQQMCENLLRDIFQSLQDEVSSQSSRDPASIGISGNGDVDLRLLVHQSQAGCVIGKGGMKIKELRETSGLRLVKVYSGLCPGSNDRVVQLVGAPDDILSVLSKILSLLDDSPPRGSLIKYDARGFDEMAAEGYGGWVSSQMQRQPAQNMGPHPGQMHAYAAPPHMHAGGAMGGPPRAPIGAMGRGAPIGRLPGIGDQMGPGPMGDLQQTQQVSIPDSLTGSIMGRGGQRIKQIRLDSGADIRIDKGAPNEDRIITITGTPDQIQNAQYLLQMCVKKYSGQY